MDEQSARYMCVCVCVCLLTLRHQSFLCALCSLCAYQCAVHGSVWTSQPSFTFPQDSVLLWPSISDLSRPRPLQSETFHYGELSAYSLSNASTSNPQFRVTVKACTHKSDEDDDDDFVIILLKLI